MKKLGFPNESWSTTQISFIFGEKVQNNRTERQKKIERDLTFARLIERDLTFARLMKTFPI